MVSNSIVIYFNSLLKGARKTAERYREYFLKENIHRVIAIIPSTADREKDLAMLRQLQNDTDEFIAIGGDGTLNIVAQVAAFTDIAVTVIPLGTGNDFALDLGIKGRCWRMNAAIKATSITIGRAGDLFFVNHAGTGLSADLKGLQPRWLKRFAGSLSYLLAIVRYLTGPMERRSAILRDKGIDDFQVVAVSKYIGGGIPVNPDGSRSQQYLYWLAVPRRSRWQQTKALLLVMRGKSEQCSWLVRDRAAEFTLGDSENAFELDGDILGIGPVQVSCCPAALRVNLPLTD
ncbi:diacylglycerol/lipid kinase family protein [Pseudidiomarina sp.]|uniref:diacylglycerol/lipid kinase family protein n=1 Tax=Pseudidiomarina sp. TaxID=2081707 RepID=UPI00299EF785|nr:diacylglycerol kinase family protein [Pseudidiomarina sp.]MDX1705534.1 diacylglycerol kinase family protein [Pseudidiomarina sp.]